MRLLTYSMMYYPKMKVLWSERHREQGEEKERDAAQLSL